MRTFGHSILRERPYLFGSWEDVSGLSNEPLFVSGSDWLDADETPRRFLDKESYKTLKLIGRLGGPKEGTVVNDFNRLQHDGKPTVLRDGVSICNTLVLYQFQGPPDDLYNLFDCQGRNIVSLQLESFRDYPLASGFGTCDSFLHVVKDAKGKEEYVFNILWEKLKDVGDEPDVIGWQDDAGVGEDAVYHPRVLEEGSEEPFQFIRDVVPQPLIYDELGYLIPPWHLHSELRSGTIMIIDVVVVFYDRLFDKHDIKMGLERVFRAYGRTAHVVQRGVGESIRSEVSNLGNARCS